MTKRLLLIENESALVMTLTDRLTASGYEVESAKNGEAGIELAISGNFDCILLDILMPGIDGFEVCRRLRRARLDVPILMLTARGSIEDRVQGLRLGADDYLVKPFAAVELLARIEALTRRTKRANPTSLERLEAGDLEIDFRRRLVMKCGERIEMSSREFELLAYLVERRGEAISREVLLKDVWGYSAVPNTRTVDVHVAWLRQKLELNPRSPDYILTVHGVGYSFAV